MRLNYLFGLSLGRDAERAHVFAWVSVAADCWKALAPIFAVQLYRIGKTFAATSAALVWFMCFVYAVTSAIGFAAQDRREIAGDRESAIEQLANSRHAIADAERQLLALAPHRTVGEVQAAVDEIRARIVRLRDGTRVTVTTISRDCAVPNSLAAAECAEIAGLKKELATAEVAVTLRSELNALQTRAGKLRDGVGSLVVDPQSQLIADLSYGLLTTSTVTLGLALLLAAVIEVVSAFGPVVVASFINGARDTQRLFDTDAQDAGAADVVDYMAECLQAGSKKESASEHEVFLSYAGWCAHRNARPLACTNFLTAFDFARRWHGLDDRIDKIAGRFAACRRAAASHFREHHLRLVQMISAKAAASDSKSNTP